MKYIFVCLLANINLSAQAQQVDTLSADTTKAKKLKEVVVTATRTARNLMQLPLPVTTISNKEIKNRGMVRLNEILNEQTGLSVLPDAHGQGIQIQGFSPDYTMIMLDGMPLIGRSTGILDLSRITTNNIDKIEIVKGPVSSLYGSEAMAGVINIILATPQLGGSGSIAARYGTNKNADISLNGGYATDKLSLYGFVNRYSSGGYSLVPQSGSATVSPFVGYTLNGRVGYKFSDATNFKVQVRNYTNTADNNFLVDNDRITGDGTEKDLNMSAGLTHKFSDKFTGDARLYHAGYSTKSLLINNTDGSVYDQTFFDQNFNRAELQGDYKIINSLRFTGGVGGQTESVVATRYNDKKNFQSGYAYGQADWTPFKRLNIITGGRFDTHSVYRSQFSPKLAASYQLSEKFVILASTGKGYKAPDFRQLYLNFTNAVVGYSVFGTEEAVFELKKLQDAGQIQSILIDPATLRTLNAESSTAYNFGYRYRPINGLMWTVNMFRNNIRYLIDSEPIAIKTNGQSVFSYLNLQNVYTQGAETDVTYNFSKHWTVAGGMQFLQAYDQSVLDKIKEGQVFGNHQASRETVKVTKSQYGGLLNRSKYMGNARIAYQDDKTGIITSLRAIYRGRYGFSDVDGNGIVNRDDEYVKGYVLFNASVSKMFLKNQLRLQVTGENLGNYKNHGAISNLPGTLVYAGITYNFNKP
ncbi:TonB-dependent receptor [Mucilaginibacter sp. RB4R14]|uniref:TonB-dependent receptor plug domain-containing protein n=1 Tax=Mucilaginibacter aurantiaciroseus TaxID=2949308 RepID=UPI0020902310|nr:TonB-dependent receptor [Mucilaginibacter aurantiaciroseus]MCO5934949.1 TonB-dependent receptor [Mucilaginibacter aurantiaciroseus]